MVWIDMLYIAKGGAVVGHLPKKLSLTVHMEWCDSLPYGGRGKCSRDKADWRSHVGNWRS